jgi:hypothetical protein
MTDLSKPPAIATRGKPLFPLEERSTPQSDVPGEKSWRTQPFPQKPDALVAQRLTDAGLWDTDEAIR